ncbi:TlpA family protein disulfide reductase [Reichenbachiella carrageenanivorans]|uniref:TlpA family protein disulfide reductase n=1 Tax=Reichenbachiella carrageenanivorans TaxID=2979869 RepID=A0ABY6CZH2_9BACT|nr:TlpA disulfide reductase family protein [Reichenbachiella carrageenanivorans]UXX79311.1 TlpA family protein disulfide reductase [Reichenbachiella carrageenanivorans]
MTKHLGLLFTCALLVGACAKKEGVTISGTYENPEENQWVKIELIMDNQLTVIDSFQLAPSGVYSRTIKVTEPSFYRLNFYNRHVTNMILDKSDIQLVKDKNDPRNGYKVSGSIDMDYIYQLSTLKQDFEKQSQALNGEFMEARNNGNMAALEDIRSRFMKMKTANDKQIKSAIMKMDGSIAGILATSFIDEEAEFAFMDSLAQKYKKELPNSSYTKQLVDKVEAYRKLAIGSPAPEISLPNPEGKIVTLSSFKGKYVMIDFWAAWCRPCRMENPNVVRMYQAYNDKGFEILGVSLDRKKESWVEAIAQDQLTWAQVSDLKYFESEAAQIYQINSIPATYLIGPDGKIVAKNLRGPELEAKLKEIFG